MLVHLRLVVPRHLVDQVLALLTDNPVVTDVVRLRDACIEPAGDLIEADVARESASSLLDDLARTGLDDEGGICLVPITANPFRRADEIEQSAAGDSDDAVIWDVVEAQAEAAVRPTVIFHLFLLVATLIASIAVLTDSSILVVGAMVVGPEFSTVAAICTGLVLRRSRLVIDGARLLVLGFAVVIAATALLAVMGSAAGWIDADMVTRPRPQTGFIYHPDRWSLLVALLAGVAGVLALSSDKSQALVGVFISVTTVPAASNLALGLALQLTDEIKGSLAQLGMNVAGMIVAGTVTLLVQRVAWRHVERITRPMFRPSVAKADQRRP